MIPVPKDPPAAHGVHTSMKTALAQKIRINLKVESFMILLFNIFAAWKTF